MKNLNEFGADAYSYLTCIRTKLGDGTWVLNRTKYTPTTSKHQREALGDLKGIEVFNVPQGVSAEELRALAEIGMAAAAASARLP